MLFLTALATLLARPIALARILLLLSWFLTAALLLSGALLAGILILLTRLVLLLRHSGISLVGVRSKATARIALWLPAEPGSSRFRNPGEPK